jgi:flagellar hook-length control protein FliK
MMPAISLIPLPALPPFQLLPEADLNFDAVLATVAPPAPQTPTVAERIVPDETLLPFLGSNPVKVQMPAEQAPPAKDETLDTPKDALAELVANPALPPAPQISAVVQVTVASSPALLSASTTAPQSNPSLSVNAGVEGSTSTGSVRTGLETVSLPEIPDTPPSPQPFGLAPGGSLSKPSLSLNVDEEKGSTSTATHREPVRTELGVMPLPVTQSGSTEAKEPSPPQPITSTPSADPLRFVVERQLDLARDSRWLDALARDIVAVAETPDRLSFRLSPPQLGRLDVDLSSSDSGLSVRMNTSTEAAAQIVAAAQPRLIDELKSQGMRVAEAQVSTGGGGSQGQGQQQQREADQMIEFARARFEQANDTHLTRPDGRFA